MNVKSSYIAVKSYQPGILKMHTLVIITFVIIYVAGLFSRTPISKLFVFLPEFLLSIVVAVTIFQNKRILTHFSFYILVTLLGAAVIGFALNGNKPISFLLGFRSYFKYFLIFLVPLILQTPSYNKLKLNFVKVIFYVALAQIPIALIQKFILYRGASGDLITGSLGASSSGELTQFIFFTIPLIIAAYLTKQAGMRKTIFLVLLIMIPTLINETKVTIIFIGALGLFFVFLSKSVSLTKKLIILTLTPLFIYGFFIAYSKFNPYNKRKGNPILNIVNETASGKLYEQNYFMKNGSLNRIPNVQFAYANITRSHSKYILGVSLGNASNSFIPQGVGVYFKKFEKLKIDGIQGSRMIWEWGILGCFLWVILMGTLFKEGLSLKKNIYGIWFSATCIIAAIGMIYTNNILFDQLGYYFWFLAGVVVREKIEYKNTIVT